MPTPVTLPLTVPEGFVNAAELAGLLYETVLLEGTMQAQEGGVTMVFGGDSPPPTTQAGTTFPSGGGMGMGPVADPASGWPLRQIWVRRSNAGSPALFVIMGVIE